VSGPSDLDRLAPVLASKPALPLLAATCPER
jgi:hypothetical protein